MIQRRTHRSTPSRAFTITELLVAIGAVSVLTVGIGRIVASINGIVAQGGAIEEVQASARAIEQLMRRDFELLNQMPADETYIAIRQQEMGSVNRPIYHDEEDRRADRKDGVTAYDEGSRAIYARLDEMVFIAGNSNESNFASRQINGFHTASQTTAAKARIYYGHGLKPKPYDPEASPSDPYAEWPARDPADRYPENINAPRVPPRIPEPDGFFGDQPGPTDPSLLTSIEFLFGRNQYANEWALARQPVLLIGPEVMGSRDKQPKLNGAAGVDRIIRDSANSWFFGSTQGVAPTLLDRETYIRWWESGVAASSPTVAHLGPGQGESQYFNKWMMPVPRMIRHGVTDIAAQSHIDLRNFVEGDPPPGGGGWTITGDIANSPDTSLVAIHGAPYSGDGWLTFTSQVDQAALEAPGYGTFGLSVDQTTIGLIQSPLWNWGNKQPPNPLTGVDHLRVRDNVSNMRTALASTIVRPIVEPNAKLIDRVQEWDNLDAPMSGAGFMDNHAVISARCSNFEIAWSDGSRLKLDETPLDIDGNAVPEYFPGDIIWFDISRVKEDDPNNRFSDRQTMQFYVQNHRRKIDWGGSGQVPVLLSQYGTLPTIHGRDYPIIPHLSDFIEPGMTTYPTIGEFGDIENSIPPSGPLQYNPELLGSTPSRVVLEDGTVSTSDDQGEMLTIWPFRRLSVVQDNLDQQLGQDNVPWPKPSLIRVRLTLHDRGNLLKDGKDYEFIFEVNLKNSGSS